MAEVLKTQTREPKGKLHTRRLRDGGSVPANLYGHGESNVYLSIAADELRAALRHGARVVDLQGVVSEKAFIRELQWDTFGTEVLHVDFTRVSADERLEVSVTVELRGIAPGTKDGGMVEHVVHELDIECLAIEIPEKLTGRVTSLGIGDSLLAKDVELPPGVKLLSDPEMVVAHCIMPQVEEDGEGGPTAEGAEPEVIKREKAEGDEDEE